MPFLQLIFFAFAGLLLFSGLMVITLKNPVQNALFLVLAFFAAAGLWLLVEAEFLALVLVLVYVGAVMTLFLFVVMTLNINIDRKRQGFVRYLPYGIVLMALIVGLMIYVLGPQHYSTASLPAAIQHTADFSNVKALGAVLYTDYAYSFEIGGILLLVAIIAAISLAFRGTRNTKQITASAQIKIDPKDRVRLVK